MQPYIYPYIGYFHLIHASSLFVFYDDVHFKNRGWINRNRILNQGTDLLFTIPLSKATQNKLIKDTMLAIDDTWKNKFYKQLFHVYKKAPCYKIAIEPIMSVFYKHYNNVADLAIESISVVNSYLSIDFNHIKSSICSPETRGMERADRLIEIAKQQKYKYYVSAPGGRQLYQKEYFLNKGVSLSYVKSHQIEYSQFLYPFVPNLSIIDVIMFNSKEVIKDFLSAYSLE